MKTINKSNILFSTKNNTYKVQCCKTRIGKVFPIGMNASRFNTMLSAVKMSSLVMCLDKLLVEKAALAYTKKDTVLLERGPVLVLTDGTNVRTNGKEQWDDILLADMLWEMECNDNTEMSDIFVDFCKSMLPLKESQVGMFCDSYFHHNSKKISSLKCDDSLVKAEIEAGIRSGLLKRSKKLELIPDLPESMFSNVKAVSSPERTKETNTVKESVNKDEFLKACRNGDFIIKHKWTEEDKELIPDLSFLDDMSSNEIFRKLVNKINFRTNKVIERMGDKTYRPDDVSRLKDLGKDFINVSLVGKPGTGKSHNVHAAAAACGLPIYVVNCSHNTDEDRFEGMTKIVEGKPEAIPTEAVKCFKNGGILLLEEVNLAQSAVIMGALGQAVEYPFILKQDGYKDVRRHPLCIVVSTMNVGTAGTKTVAQQFANRFKTSYVMDDPEGSEFVERLMLATGESKKLCEWVYKCYEIVTESIREDNAQADVDGILNSLSVRTCIGAIENIQEGSGPKEAIKDSIIGKIAEQDAEVAQNCLQVVETIANYRF